MSYLTHDAFTRIRGIQEQNSVQQPAMKRAAPKQKKCIISERMRTSVFATFGTWHLSVREYLFTIAELNLVAGLSDPNASRLLQYEISANSALLLRPCNTFFVLVTAAGWCGFSQSTLRPPRGPYCRGVRNMMKIHSIY